MSRDQPRLPGVGRGNAPRGRHRRAFDKFARHARSVLGADPVLEHQLTELRGLEDRKDEMEHDPDASPHTFATVCRTAHDLRAELIARLDLADDLDDVFALLADDDPPA